MNLSDKAKTLPHFLYFFFFNRFLNTGAKNELHGSIFKELLQTPNFRITVVAESDTVELCGALKVKIITYF